MHEPNPTVANAELWAAYFEGLLPQHLSAGPAEDWQPFLDGAAARLATGIGLLLGGPIAWLYHSNRHSTLSERGR